MQDSMMVIRRGALSILIAAIFVTTLCAQACLSPVVADSDCPVHHTSDCCKHDGSDSDRATLNAVTLHVVSKHTIVPPLQTAQAFNVQIEVPRLYDQVLGLFKCSLPKGPTPIPLPLRI